MWGAGPEAKNIQMPKAQRAHTKLCSPVPRAPIPREQLLRMSSRKAEVGSSAFQVTVQLQGSPACVCSSRQVPAAPPALPPSLHDLQASRPHGRLLFDLMLLRLLQFKCLAQNFFWGQTSGSSYGALVSAVFVSSPVSLTLFQLPSLVRASSQ